MEYTEKALKNKPDMLNFLRVAATLIVFLLHGRGSVAGIDEGPWLLNMLSRMPAWAGVWILFFLSGYLMQKGFLGNRYPIFSEGRLRGGELGKFYWKRFLKIAPAYYIYIVLFLVFNNSAYFFKQPLICLKILLFAFNGNGGIGGIGHLWYISLAMWLYLLAPFFHWAISKIKPTWLLWATLAAVVSAGLAARYFLCQSDLSWYTWVYTFLPCNFDLFIGGMLACSLTERLRDRACRGLSCALKIVSALLFAGLVIYNCYVYTVGAYEVYRVLLPSVYLLICALVLLAFDGVTVAREKLSANALRRNPMRFIDWFSPYTYAFYILHIAVLSYVASFFSHLPFFGAWHVVPRYFAFFLTAFGLTLLLAVIYQKMINGLVGGGRKKKSA